MKTKIELNLYRDKNALLGAECPNYDDPKISVQFSNAGVDLFITLDYEQADRLAFQMGCLQQEIERAKHERKT